MIDSLKITLNNLCRKHDAINILETLIILSLEQESLDKSDRDWNPLLVALEDARDISGNYPWNG
jgi:hypothetical protein